VSIRTVNNGQQSNAAFELRCLFVVFVSNICDIETPSVSTGFLNSKKEKKKEKGKKSKTESVSSEDDNSSNDQVNNGPRIDDEGYIIRETSTTNTNKNDIDSFYSDSDSDSDDEQVRKFHIEIKPIHNNCGPSVAQLQETVKSLSISPLQHSRRQMAVTSSTSTPEDTPFTRSLSQSLYKQDSDVFSVFSNSTSNTSTPLGASDRRNASQNYQSLIETPSSDNNANEDRYAALRSIFTDSSIEENSPNVILNNSGLSKSMSTSTVMGPPMTTIPRPPSKRARLSHPLHTNHITRCKSYGNLTNESRMTPISIGSSRGPSPVTIGMCDVIPIAVAIQESISARFKGADETKCQIEIYGNLKIAFPAGVIQVLTNNPSPAVLSFKLKNTSKIDKIHTNNDVVNECDSSDSGERCFQVNMNGLTNSLRKLFELSPSARYYNVDMLKYKLKCAPGAKGSPLHVVTHWKCDSVNTGLKIDYKYNPYALSSLEPLKNVVFSAFVDGSVTNCESKPVAEWNSSKNQALWRFDKVSRDTESSGLGALRAKFSVLNGPSNPSPISVQFSGNNVTFSGVEFELTNTGYRISLVKKLVTSGRYISEADYTINYASI
ncbi:F-BAR domain only protein 2-like protein, partial [Leptotrombidium deliense]